MIPISPLASSVQPSATLVAGARARQLKTTGVRVFDFGLGEPDFPTPEHVCRAATQAMLDGHTHYTPAAGLPELRAAVARRYQTLFGLACTAEQAIICSGAKHTLHVALLATVGPGDEVVIPSPYWVSYSDLVQMAGATPRLIETSPANDFKMTPALLRAALTPRSRLVMFNSPGNPTGSVYTRAELEALVDVVLDSRAGILSDEIYEQLVYDDARGTCVATLRPELPARTVTVSGASKSYAMTGWRMGWAVGPTPVIQAMSNIQSQETGCPSSISQYAALAAVEGDQTCVETMRREFQARRDLVCRRLAALPRVHFSTPRGAFYVFFNVAGHFGRTLGGRAVHDSAEFCQVALDVAHVNLVPGSAFGREGYVRLSFAASRETINGGMDQLAMLLAG